MVSPGIKQEGINVGRLILQKDLSPDVLKAFRIRIASERSNAVLIHDPQYGSDTTGQLYLRLYCVSK